MTMNGRRRLPDRRDNRTGRLKWRPPGADDSHRLEVTIGFDDGGRVREIFATGPKTGSSLRLLLEDACVLASHLLQSGYSLAELARSMGRDDDDTPSSAIGAVVRFAAELEATTPKPRAPAGATKPRKPGD